MSDAEKVEQTLNNIEKLVHRLSNDTSLLRKGRKLEDIMKDMPPLETAKLNSSLGYTINCLYKSIMMLSSLHESKWNRRREP